MTNFNYVSLFSGIGGFEQALNKLGGNCVMASEFDKFAEQSYEALYGHKTAGDITKIDAKDVPDHDLLVGGFPCQSFSVAGKREGFEDTRGTLFFDIVRIAAEKKPKALLLENVKGLVNHDKGKTLDVMIETLNSIGYTVDFDVLNSKFFGVPQNRERIFIIAVRDDLVSTEPWSPEGNTVVPKGKRRIGGYEGVKTFNFDFPKQADVTTRLRDVLETEVDEKYYLSEDKTETLVAQLNEGSRGDQNTTKQQGIELPAIGASRGRSPINPSDRTPGAHVEQRLEINTSDTTNTLTSVQKDNYVVEPKIALAGNVNPSGRGMNGSVYDINGGLSPTLTTNKGEGLKMTEAPRYRIRKLTPLECFRLQGFPDEAHQTLVDAGISDSQRYKQAGNAVTVSVIEAIGERLIPMIAGER